MKEFLTDKEEKICEFCFKIAMLYNRRERLIADEQPILATRLDIHIKQYIQDLRGWLLKNDPR